MSDQTDRVIRQEQHHSGWLRFLTDVFLRGARITLMTDWVHHDRHRLDTTIQELIEAADKIEGVVK